MKVENIAPNDKCESCSKIATHFLGYHGFDGSGTRFIVTKKFCDKCLDEYRRTKNPSAGFIQHIR